MKEYCTSTGVLCKYMSARKPGCDQKDHVWYAQQIQVEETKWKDKTKLIKKKKC